ncbi:MAG: hypothetical protein V2I65_02600 [Paracoccaceae bacterium]|nr:hypothetical protein [Paracoccaceae bacterium]
MADDFLLTLHGALSNVSQETSLRLFQVSFGSWRQAQVLALSGATSQVPPLLRHALEASGYSLLFSVNEDWENLWWKRDESRNARDKFAREGMKEVRSAIGSMDDSLLSRYKSLVDHLIDFGARPNLYQVARVSNIASGDDALSTQVLAWLEERNSDIIMVSGAAIILSELFELTWPAHFKAVRGSDLRAETLGQMRLFMNLHHAETYAPKGNLG